MTVSIIGFVDFVKKELRSKKNKSEIVRILISVYIELAFLIAMMRYYYYWYGKVGITIALILIAYSLYKLHRQFNNKNDEPAD